TPPVKRTALVLDGGGAQSVVLVRVLGQLGWNVLCESETRSSRSRWTTGTVNLPSPDGPDADPDGYVAALREICSRVEVSLVAPTSDYGLLPVAQEYVTVRACSVTAVVHSGAVIASSARATLSFFPLEGGTSVWKRTIPVETLGVEEALAFMRRWGLECVAELEYVLSPLGPRFMELGPRIHGWIP